MPTPSGHARQSLHLGIGRSPQEAGATPVCASEGDPREYDERPTCAGPIFVRSVQAKGLVGVALSLVDIPAVERELRQPPEDSRPPPVPPQVGRHLGAPAEELSASLHVAALEVDLPEDRVIRNLDVWEASTGDLL